MWQCKKCCTENEDQLSYCKNCGMSKAKSLRQPRLNKKKNKKKHLADIQFAQKTKTKIMKYREDNDSVLLFYEKRI